MESIERAIEVRADIGRVYEQWTRIEEYPRFMRSLQEVRSLGEERYRSRAERDGTVYESTFQITLNIPDRRIAWRTLSGVESSGVVCFEAHSPEVTTVSLKMVYAPDAGWQEPAALAARLESHLHNFKALMENEEPLA